MGTDIHAYIEYRSSDDTSWHPFGRKFNLERDYRVFGYLAGVRFEVPHIPLRGVPSNMSYIAMDDWWLRIVDTICGEENEITFEDAMSYAKSGSDVLVDSNGLPTRVSHPDWHSPTWMKLAEFEAILQRFPIDDLGVCWRGVLGAATALEKANMEVRIIFWFDN